MLWSPPPPNSSPSTHPRSMLASFNGRLNDNYGCFDGEGCQSLIHTQNRGKNETKKHNKQKYCVLQYFFLNIQCVLFWKKSVGKAPWVVKTVVFWGLLGIRFNHRTFINPSQEIKLWQQQCICSCTSCLFTSCVPLLLPLRTPTPKPSSTSFLPSPQSSHSPSSLISVTLLWSNTTHFRNGTNAPTVSDQSFLRVLFAPAMPWHPDTMIHLDSSSLATFHLPLPLTCKHFSLTIKS